ncbi:hypothetical protein HK098_005245 [Nowakowskiella sp. JEL0407]|nr:hypothetical protein HK098_005245 [Nowakowskiella sp. JEL0407]
MNGHASTSDDEIQNKASRDGYLIGSKIPSDAKMTSSGPDHLLNKSTEPIYSRRNSEETFRDNDEKKLNSRAVALAADHDLDLLILTEVVVAEAPHKWYTFLLPPKFKFKLTLFPFLNSKDESPPESRVLGVFGLSLYTTERDLEEVFAKYGEIEKICLIYDRYTKKSRGYGFITMRNINDAIDARNTLSGTMLRDRRMRTSQSTPRSSRTSPPI